MPRLRPPRLRPLVYAIRSAWGSRFVGYTTTATTKPPAVSVCSVGSSGKSSRKSGTPSSVGVAKRYNLSNESSVVGEKILTLKMLEILWRLGVAKRSFSNIAPLYLPRRRLPPTDSRLRLGSARPQTDQIASISNTRSPQRRGRAASSIQSATSTWQSRQSIPRLHVVRHARPCMRMHVVGRHSGRIRISAPSLTTGATA